MRLIDADKMFQKVWTGSDDVYTVNDVLELIDEQPTIALSTWHRVTDAIFYEDKPPDKKTDAIFYYEWTGISGTVYRETSIISLNELMALGCRPIAWMEKPEPPKEDAR